MSIDTYHAKVKSSIWKAIAQSGLPINSIPMDQQNKFVDHLTDNLLVTVNELLEDAAKPLTVAKPPIELEEEETRALVKKMKIYDSVVSAFSKTGIPAMVLKSQLPAINQE